MEHASVQHLIGLCTVLISPTIAQAQFEVHTHHEFPGACGGSIAVLGSGFDHVVWSTGAEGDVLAAPPGIYGFTIYDDGVLVMEGEREIESHGWEVEITPVASPDGLQLSGPVSVPYCGTQIFNAPCCHPDPAQTTISLLQDGAPYVADWCLGCADVQCAYNLVMLTGLPYGHVYTVLVTDPVCAGVSEVMQVTAHSCSNLELVTTVEDALDGEDSGSIVVTEVIPDLSEPFPISAPVNGAFILFNNLTGETIGSEQMGNTASWSGLAVGEYMLVFSPDQLCQPVNRVITITDGALVGARTASGINVFPLVADDHIMLTAPSGMSSVVISIVDLNGRVVRSFSNLSSGRISLTSLAAGSYIVCAQQGADKLRVPIIKR
ncbi:MAG: T9SS type A sorting domain-containing protein [Flavobacteriales bacterium]|nr:T9SS type A sorting domain-containing protein [Flavobacteriales bacterium]